MPQTIAEIYIFTSSSSPGKDYETLRYVDGSMSCNCPGWKFKKKITATGQRTCTHCRSIETGQAKQHAKKFISYYAPTTTTAPQRTQQEPETTGPGPILRRIRLND